MHSTVIKLPIPVRDGYTFLYWMDSKDNPRVNYNSGWKYSGGSEYEVNYDHIFDAIWEENPNSIGLHPEKVIKEENSYGSLWEPIPGSSASIQNDVGLFEKIENKEATAAEDASTESVSTESLSTENVSEEKVTKESASKDSSRDEKAAEKEMSTEDKNLPIAIPILILIAVIAVAIIIILAKRRDMRE